LHYFGGRAGAASGCCECKREETEMANGRTRLELTWIGKENRPRLEPRILIEDPAIDPTR